MALTDRSSGSQKTGDCVVCGTAATGNVKVRLPGAILRSCSCCGTWIYLPRPSPNQQASIHDSESYFDHPYFKLRRELGESQLRRCRQIFSRIGSAVDLATLPGQRLLDIGCDTGMFLAAAAQEFGVVPVGIDVAARGISIAREHGIEAYQTTIERAPEQLREFAVITAIDLIEHVPDPASLLNQIRSRLRPDGVAYIETPNIRSYVYRIGRTLSALTGGRPALLYDRLFPPQHIQYFTRSSLTSLVKACGLELAQLGTRALPAADVAASLPVRMAMSGMQSLDLLTGDRILLWALLRPRLPLG